MEKKNKISNEQKWFVGLLEAEGRVEFNENGVSKDGNKKWAFMIKVSLKNTNRRSIHRIKKI